MVEYEGEPYSRSVPLQRFFGVGRYPAVDTQEWKRSVVREVKGAMDGLRGRPEGQIWMNDVLAEFFADMKGLRVSGKLHC